MRSGTTDVTWHKEYQSTSTQIHEKSLKVRASYYDTEAVVQLIGKLVQRDREPQHMVWHVDYRTMMSSELSA